MVELGYQSFSLTGEPLYHSEIIRFTFYCNQHYFICRLEHFFTVQESREQASDWIFMSEEIQFAAVADFNG